MKITTVPALLKEAFNDWLEDRALRLSAALAYYSVFSLAPLLIIVVAIAGLFLGREAVQGQLDDQLKYLLGSEKGAEAVQSMVQGASKPSSGIFATIVGFVTLLAGAAGVFGQLKDALNTVWEVEAKPGAGIMGFVKERILSIGMILIIGFLLLISLVLTTAVNGTVGYVAHALPILAVLGPVLTFVVSFAVTTLLFAAIFKVLPDVVLDWRDVWVGAAFTAFLFEVGKQLLSLYFTRGAVASSYGVVGSLVLVLLWVYYSGLIVLFGAEFIQVYCKQTGRQMVPKKNAVAVTANQRANEGMPGESKETPVESGGIERDEAVVPSDDEYAWDTVPARLTEPAQSYVTDALLTSLAVGFGMGLISRFLPQMSRRPPPPRTFFGKARHQSAALLIPLGLAAAQAFGKAKSKAAELHRSRPSKKRAALNRVMDFLVRLAD